MVLIGSESSTTVVCVLVLFHPEMEVLGTIQRLSLHYPIVLVVNAASTEFLARLQGSAQIHLLRNERNIGLASALNRGAEYAFGELGASFIALFDQDSIPEETMPGALAQELGDSDGRIACIGPYLVDKKAMTSTYATNLQQVSGARSIPTSGTVIPRDVFFDVGPMLDSLFIDGIDHEWCFRACNKGYQVRVSSRTQMVHDMGDGALSYFGRFKPIHRSPVRHYYIVRNTLALARFDYLPLRWRVVELMKTVRRVVAYIVFSTDRADTIRLIAWAVIDGMTGRLGPCLHLKQRNAP